MCIKFINDGITVTSSGTSQTVAIPNNSTGNPARFVRLIALTGFAYVKPVTTNTGTATANSLVVNVYEEVELDVRGCTHIAYLQGTTGDKVNIIPLEM